MSKTLSLVQKVLDNFQLPLAELGLTQSDVNTSIILGLSGGLDSVVLLDILSHISKNYPNISITAVYINHNLQEESKSWDKTNQQLVTKYNSIKYLSFSVDINKIEIKNKGLEAAARTARYTIFKSLVGNKNTILLTAQHADDQAETFLLQLMRGAGPKGLAAMPKLKSFSHGLHYRPLLNIARQELETYAEQNNLTWVEDKSNQDISLDRNFLRHNILPIIKNRWPHVANSIGYSAQFCAENTELLNQYLKQDYENCSVDLSLELLGVNYLALKIPSLNKYSINHKIQLIRYWLEQQDIKSPGRAKLNQIITSVLESKIDSCAEVVWDNYAIRKYMQCLVVMPYSCTLDVESSSQSNCINYKLGEQLVIFSKRLKISSRLINVSEINKSNKNRVIFLHTDTISIKFRIGGERCRPYDRSGSVSVKKLLQEQKVPAWYRNRVPMVYTDNDIACVLGVKNCQKEEMSASLTNKLDKQVWLFSLEFY